jgi:hypothetical protein
MQIDICLFGLSQIMVGKHRIYIFAFLSKVTVLHRNIIEKRKT